MRTLYSIVAVLVCGLVARGDCMTLGGTVPASGYAVQSRQVITYSAPVQQPPVYTVPAAPACGTCTAAASFAVPSQSYGYDVAPAALPDVSYTQTTRQIISRYYVQSAPALSFAPSHTYYQPRSLSFAPASVGYAHTFGAGRAIPTRRELVQVPVYPSGHAFQSAPRFFPTGGGVAAAPIPTGAFGALRGRAAAGASAGGLLGFAEGLTGFGDGSGQFLQGALIARFLPGGGGFRFKR